VALMLLGILGHVGSDQEAASIVTALLAGLAAGSYLVIADGVNTSRAGNEAQARYNEQSPVPYHLRSPAQLAAFFTGLQQVGPAGDIPVRVYRPARPGDGARPLILNFHGGGFVFGDLRLGDWICSSVAVTVGAVVVSVDYRLAPVHRFPAAVDDCYAALVWAAGNAAGLGAGSTGNAANAPIGVMGESAGGNLAAVVCLLARDRGGPPVSHQTLLYPPTDLTRIPAKAANALVIPEPEMLAYRRHYLGDADPADPRVSPLLAGDHRGLPPALIQVGEHDPLREDGARYATALRAAGVPVRFTEYVGMPHGYLNFPGICRGARQAMAEICAEQAAALAPVHLP
jgi:acetyl esterase/lipase